MHYEINVSLNGRHLFATHERSITNKNELKRIYKLLAEKFPAKEGYCLMVSQIETIGKYVSMERIDE